MSVNAGARVLLCDDDELVRGVVRHLLEDAGFEVTAEADTADSALREVGTGNVDLVVLDLALRVGNGEDLLQRLHAQAPGVDVLVFSSFAGDPGRLLDHGALAVVNKPHFDQLDATVRELIDHSHESAPDRRRDLSRPITPLPVPTGTTLSGLEPWQSFRTASCALAPGDVVLAVDLLPDEAMRPVWDDVYRTDFRIGVARAVAATRRVQDRVSLAGSGVPVVLLVGGFPAAPEALFERVQHDWERDVGVGIPVGAYARLNTGDKGPDLIDRVVAGIHHDRSHIEWPLLML